MYLDVKFEGNLMGDGSAQVLPSEGDNLTWILFGMQGDFVCEFLCVKAWSGFPDQLLDHLITSGDDVMFSDLCFKKISNIVLVGHSLQVDAYVLRKLNAEVSVAEQVTDRGQ